MLPLLLLRRARHHAPPAALWASASAPPPASLLLLLSPPLRRWLSTPPGARKLPVELREDDLEESFVKGSGKGGQKINKVRNCVLLKHTPSGLHVRCQKTRSLEDNRRVARKLLAQKLDDQLNGPLSARNVKISRLRKRKASKKAKSRQKYAAAAGGAEDEEEDEDEDDADFADEDGDDDFDDDDDDFDDDDDAQTHAFKAKKRGCA